MSGALFTTAAPGGTVNVSDTMVGKLENSIGAFAENVSCVVETGKFMEGTMAEDLDVDVSVVAEQEGIMTNEHFMVSATVGCAPADVVAVVTAEVNDFILLMNAGGSGTRTISGPLFRFSATFIVPPLSLSLGRWPLLYNVCLT